MLGSVRATISSMTPTKDHLLECGWAVLALPYFSEVLTHGKDPCLLLHREGILLPLKRGEPVSPQTVSRLSRNLDEAVRQFHQAPLQDEWAYPFLDGVSLRMRRPSGRQRVQMLWPTGCGATAPDNCWALCAVRGSARAPGKVYSKTPRTERREVAADRHRRLSRAGGRDRDRLSAGVASALLGAQDA